MVNTPAVSLPSMVSGPGSTSATNGVTSKLLRRWLTSRRRPTIRTRAGSTPTSSRSSRKTVRSRSPSSSGSTEPPGRPIWPGWSRRCAPRSTKSTPCGGSVTIPSATAALRRSLIRASLPRPLREVAVEPRQDPACDVALVGRVADAVPLAGVDHQRGRYAQRVQRVPELLRLRGRAFDVALADEHEGRRAHVADVRDRRALRVHGGIGVDRGAEEREHPLVDPVLAVVALPVRDAGAGEGRFEAVRLRDGPHRHVAAVAEPTDTQARVVDRRDFFDGVDPGQDVAQIAAAEVLDVGRREALAL